MAFDKTMGLVALSFFASFLQMKKDPNLNFENILNAVSFYKDRFKKNLNKFIAILRQNLNFGKKVETPETSV